MKYEMQVTVKPCHIYGEILYVCRGILECLPHYPITVHTAKIFIYAAIIFTTSQLYIVFLTIGMWLTALVTYNCGDHMMHCMVS